MVPASWLGPAVSSSSSQHFVTTRACVYIYIHNVGCTVQCRSKLCKEKNIFKSVQYLNKEYSIYYPGVFDDCDTNANLQLVLDLNTIWHTGGLNNTLQRRFPRWCRLNASSPLFYHQGIFTFSTQQVVQAKKTKQITPCTFFVCVSSHIPQTYEELPSTDRCGIFKLTTCFHRPNSLWSLTSFHTLTLPKQITDMLFDKQILFMHSLEFPPEHCGNLLKKLFKKAKQHLSFNQHALKYKVN